MKKHAIVVGSSPSLLKYKRGKLIDEFNHVIRFNTYQIQGYEEYVGTKQKIWAANLGLCEHLPSVLKYMKNNDEIWHIPSNDKVETNLTYAKKKLNKQFASSSMGTSMRKFIESIQDNFIEQQLCFERGKVRTGPDKKYATTGLRGILKAIERYGMVYAHGFSFYSECVGNLKNAHYYNISNVPEHMHKAFEETPDREHNVNHEMSVFKKLISMDLVRLLERI